MRYRYEYGELASGSDRCVNQGGEWLSSEDECLREIQDIKRSITKTGVDIKIWWKVYNEKNQIVSEGVHPK